MADPKPYQPRPGHDALWSWFGLSYASWLTLPRVLMHDMPDDWQARMAQLLQEWDDTWTPGVLGDATPTVGARIDGCFARWRPELLNYRHPDHEFLAAHRYAGPETRSARG